MDYVNKEKDMMVYEVSLKNDESGMTKVLLVDAINCMDAHRKALMTMGSFGHWTILNSKIVSVRY